MDNSTDADKEPDIAVSPVTDLSPPPTGDGDILKTAYRRVGVRLLTWYAIVYVLMKIQHNNITNTAIMNKGQGTIIQHQLGNLSSEQWALIVSVYDYPHILLEPVSALLMKKATPRRWMSRMMISWGIISICQAATKNFGGLLACRCLLGMAEAGFIPGVLLHLSFWFPAERLPIRIAIVYAVSQLGGCFSGFLAFAISYLNGKAGLSGWQYLFIIEGILPVIGGIFCIFYLHNYPSDANFLSLEEKHALLRNTSASQPHSGDKAWDWAQVKRLFADYTTYLFLLIWICHSIGAKGIYNMLPTVIHQLGMTTPTMSQLTTLPTYVLGSAGLLLIAYLIRQKKMKPWMAALGLETLGVVCYVVLISVEQPLVKYLMVVLTSVAAVGVIPILWPERIRSTAGTTHAGLAIGITSAATDLHGIVGPQIYQKKFGPTFKIPFCVSIGLMCLTMIGIVFTWIVIRRRDRRSTTSAEEEEREGVEMVNIQVKS